jgi:hypothetical protein
VYEAVASVNNFISSPFLASIAVHDTKTPPTKTETLVYDKNGNLVPGARNTDPETVPEPGTFWSLGSTLALVFALIEWRSRSKTFELSR